MHSQMQQSCLRAQKGSLLQHPSTGLGVAAVNSFVHFLYSPAAASHLQHVLYGVKIQQIWGELLDQVSLSYLQRQQCKSPCDGATE